MRTTGTRVGILAATICTASISLGTVDVTQASADPVPTIAAVTFTAPPGTSLDNPQGVVAANGTIDVSNTADNVVASIVGAATTTIAGSYEGNRGERRRRSRHRGHARPADRAGARQGGRPLHRRHPGQRRPRDHARRRHPPRSPATAPRETGASSAVPPRGPSSTAPRAWPSTPRATSSSPTPTTTSSARSPRGAASRPTPATAPPATGATTGRPGGPSCPRPPGWPSIPSATSTSPTRATTSSAGSRPPAIDHDRGRQRGGRSGLRRARRLQRRRRTGHARPG